MDPLAIATTQGSTICWYAMVTSLSSACAGCTTMVTNVASTAAAAMTRCIGRANQRRESFDRLSCCMADLLAGSVHGTQVLSDATGACPDRGNTVESSIVN